MLRAAIVIMILASLVAVMVFGPGYIAQEPPGQETAAQHDQALPGCRPLSETCSWGSGDDQGEVRLEQVADSASGPELQLTLTYPEPIEAPLLILKGDSMYMGEYPLRMQRLERGHRYRVTFTPPFCTTDPNMTWRAELSDANTRLAIPFRILFEGHGRS